MFTSPLVKHYIHLRSEEFFFARNNLCTQSDISINILLMRINQPRGRLLVKTARTDVVEYFGKDIFRFNSCTIFVKMVVD